MRAVCWYDQKDVRVEEVPDPVIINPRDAIVAVSSTGVSDSDLLLHDGHDGAMRPGDVMGHEFVGEVVDVGSAVKEIRVGDRVAVPSLIACGQCWYCKRGEWALCDNSNPNAWQAEKLMGVVPAGRFGFSHVFGGYAGGQADYVRVPFADVGCVRLDAEMSDDKAICLSDALPAAYMASEQAEIKPDDTVVVWGCGAIGQLAVMCARLFEPDRVIAVDPSGARLVFARDRAGADVIVQEQDAVDTILEETGGRGADVVIVTDRREHAARSSNGTSIKAALGFDERRDNAEIVGACRKGGTVSLADDGLRRVGDGFLRRAASNGLAVRTGPVHVHRYTRPLLDRMEREDLDPSFVVTHRLVLPDAAMAYDLLDRKEGCLKVVLEP